MTDNERWKLIKFYEKTTKCCGNTTKLAKKDTKDQKEAVIKEFEEHFSSDVENHLGMHVQRGYWGTE